MEAVYSPKVRLEIVKQYIINHIELEEICKKYKIIIRKTGDLWTKQQKEYLPDGVRQSRAKHILIEFKYSQSFSMSALIQTLSYDLYYKNTKKEKLETKKIQTFLVLSKTPSKNNLEKTGYYITNLKGVY